MTALLSSFLLYSAWFSGGLSFMFDSLSSNREKEKESHRVSGRHPRNDPSAHSFNSWLCFTKDHLKMSTEYFLHSIFDLVSRGML